MSILPTLDHQLVGGNLCLLNHILLYCYFLSVLFTIALKTNSTKKQTKWCLPTIPSKLTVKHNMVKTNETRQPMLWEEGGLSTVHSRQMKASTEIPWGPLPILIIKNKKSQGLFVESSKVRPVGVFWQCCKYVNSRLIDEIPEEKKKTG